MPFYEYICPLCGHEFEQLQKFSDQALTNCPACHKDGLQKKISAPAFHLKGSGWYVTDFKDGAKPREKADNKGEVNASASTNDDVASNTSKPEAKANTEVTAKSEAKTESTPDVKPKTSKDGE